MTETSTVLVTGAGGFIGGALVQRLVAAGRGDVRAVDSKPLPEWHRHTPGVDERVADLTIKESCYEAAEGRDEIYSLASDMGGMGFIEQNKAQCMLSVLINTHTLLAARDLGARRLFFASSACVYNADRQATTEVAPLKEADAYPALPEDGYGWEKLFSERMCRHFTEDFGLETRVARYHNVYGPFGAWDGGREKAPAAICRKVAQAKVRGLTDLVVWGDGEQTRSFTYVDDCVEGTLRLMASDEREPVNLGSDRLVSINGLVDIIEAIAGVRLERRYELDAPQGVRGRNSDNSRLRSVLGWEPGTSLEAGLATTYRWVEDQVIKSERC
jgi:nucleoside-diphosphate-sugar epimerase